MLDKLFETNEYKVSIRQAGGIIQISDLSVSGRTLKQMTKRLDEAIKETLKIIGPYNKELMGEKKKKEKSPPVPPSKEKSPQVKGLE